MVAFAFNLNSLDLNNLITSVGLIAAAWAAVVTRSKVKEVHGDVRTVKKEVRNGVDLVGGEHETLRDMISSTHEMTTSIQEMNEQVIRFWEYQRTRNHDIGNAVTTLQGGQVSLDQKISESIDVQFRILAVLERISEQLAEQGA